MWLRLAEGMDVDCLHAAVATTTDAAATVARSDASTKWCAQLSTDSHDIAYSVAAPDSFSKARTEHSLADSGAVHCAHRNDCLV
jgi:hypothetical protein